MTKLILRVQSALPEFDPAFPYTGCKLCGRVYQSALDRDPGYGLSADHQARRAYDAMTRRKMWSIKHAATHSDTEHLNLARSGRWCTPEAAQKLAALGVISLIDLVMDEEVNDALRTAKAAPEDGIES